MNLFYALFPKDTLHVHIINFLVLLFALLLISEWLCLAVNMEGADRLIISLSIYLILLLYGLP